MAPNRVAIRACVTAVCCALAMGCAAAMKTGQWFFEDSFSVEDRRPLMIAATETLDSPVAPRWRQQQTAPDVYRLLTLPGERLLVAARGWMLLDALTGKVLWKQDSLPERGAVVSLAPLVISEVYDHRPGGKLYAVNVESGAILWRREIKHPYSLAGDSVRHRLLIVERPDTLVAKLSAIDAATSGDAWAREFGFVGPAPTLLVGDDIYLGARGTIRIDGATGAPRWRADSLHVADFGQIGSRFWGIRPDGGMLLFEASGSLRWQEPASPPPLRAMALDATTVYLVRGDSNTARVYSLNIDSGRPGWTSDVAGRVTGTPVRADSLLLVPTIANGRRTVHALAATTGAIKFATRLAGDEAPRPADSTILRVATPAPFPEMRLGHRLPCTELPGVETSALSDVLTPRGQLVVVTRETGVAGMSLRDGRVLWNYDVASPEATSLCATYNHLSNALYARAVGQGQALRQSQLGAHQASVASQRAAYESRQRQIADARAGRSGSVIVPSYEQQMAEISAQQKSEQLDAAIGLGMALGAVIAEVKNTVRIEPRMVHVERLTAVASESHFGAVQGDWYVRAFSRGGRVGRGKASWEPCLVSRWKYGVYGKTCDGYEGRQGVLVVDLRNGHWAELTTAPSESGVDMVTLNLQMPSLSPDARQLYVAAAGVDTTGWAAGSRVPSTYSFIQSVPQSLLAFDLAKVALRPPEQYGQRQSVLRGRPFDPARAASSVRPDSTTLDDLERTLGPAFTLNATIAAWEYIVERNGRVEVQRMECALTTDRKVRSCEAGALRHW